MPLRAPYWQFTIKAHQQAALERLSNKLENRALVAYASPAFDTHRDLYAHIETHSVIDNSSFVRVIRLSSHDRWTYDAAGTLGYACTEPEQVDDKAFTSQIENVASQATDGPTGFAEHLNALDALAQAVREVCLEEMGAAERQILNVPRHINPHAEFLLLLFSQLELYWDREHPLGRAAESFVTVRLFCRVFGLDWWVIGN